jgi:hypothetical protein
MCVPEAGSRAVPRQSPGPRDGAAGAARDQATSAQEQACVFRSTGAGVNKNKINKMLMMFMMLMLLVSMSTTRR